MVDAIVEFDYKAQHDDELTITAGDIITKIKKEDGGWWEGELKGRRGLFPDNFVRELKKDTKKDQNSKPPDRPTQGISNGNAMLSSEAVIRSAGRGERTRRRRCQVAFSYMPQNEDELELKVGEFIEVLGEVEEGWWEGVLNGRTGMFPSNFIKEIVTETEIGGNYEQQIQTAGFRDTTGSESDGGDSKSEGTNGTSGTETQPKKIRGFGFGDIFKDKPIKLRPRSIEMENEIVPIEKAMGKKMPPTVTSQDTMKIETESKTKPREYCKVLFPYEAMNEDELAIREGDIVTVLNKECVDVGWWEGEINGKKGVFPDNFVKLLPPDFEKELHRPKKPPPPSAPVAKSGTSGGGKSIQITSTHKNSRHNGLLFICKIETNTANGTSERKQDIRKIPPERPDTLPQRPDEKERSDRDHKVADPVKHSVPSIPPKKPRPPKTNSLNRPGTLPPRRPERPSGPVTHVRSESPKSEVGINSVSSTPERDPSSKSNDIDVEGFDSVVTVGEKLSHPTASRPKSSGRRPPSQSLTSSSLSSPDIFDSPSPEEEKDELALAQRAVEASKKTTRSAPTSQMPDNRTVLPPKPGGLISSVGFSHGASGAPSAFHTVAAGSHRSNSPSFSSAETRQKADHSQSPLEELQSQVKELRSIIETMKDQQKKEIKQLLSELDEEKKIRLRLQMDVNEIKKSLQSK
ncbi:SH3 domain-containing kinase-binding protein 1 isoform X3 [Xenopus laevis]|uniref:SH3 domain-containing kinase-binding protein 1 isoform X3 n=1 Tax=Xenopus laevis TaxID=8355 RepID=A0A8J1MDB4_XENLA|nr:SH3 domain-containing kinase-binding protein 1 isoform X3 [Xenopus laevis]